MKRNIKNNCKFLAASQVGRTAGGAAFGVWVVIEIMSLVLGILTLRCLFNFQVGMLDRHVGMQL